MVTEAALQPANAKAGAGQTGKVSGQIVYAIGDIHGCYDPLRALLDRIARDANARAAGRTPVLIFLGDYVDRGPDSARVIDALCWLKRHAPYEVHFLKGNHDAVMAGFIADPAGHRDWLRFGGVETLQSYGVTPPPLDADRAQLTAARDDLLERLPVAHLRFLEQLDPMAMIGDYAFVHAGIRPKTPLAEQAEGDLLWIREDFLDSPDRHEKIVVHGHTWASAEPEMLPNRIGVDTGAYETGVLTAVRLEDGRAEFMSVGTNIR
jgi:serine/threonine protein phosphatase 1